MLVSKSSSHQSGSPLDFIGWLDRIGKSLTDSFLQKVDSNWVIRVLAIVVGAAFFWFAKYFDGQVYQTFGVFFFYHAGWKSQAY